MAASPPPFWNVERWERWNRPEKSKGPSRKASSLLFLLRLNDQTQQRFFDLTCSLVSDWSRTGHDCRRGVKPCLIDDWFRRFNQGRVIAHVPDPPCFSGYSIVDFPFFEFSLSLFIRPCVCVAFIFSLFLRFHRWLCVCVSGGPREIEMEKTKGKQIE